VSVTVVSCVYGKGYDQFIPSWEYAVCQLDPAPDYIIVLSDRKRKVAGATVHVRPCHWTYPQAFYLQNAAARAETDWVWFLDIDDVAMEDALHGLDEVEADVWQMGYETSEGTVYAPEQLTGREYLELSGNPFTSCSAVRTDIFEEAGGFRDVAFQDWALWRKLALIGATFEMSGRAHYVYRSHPKSRTATELLPEVRILNLREMAALES
jgi:hypothetical protein